MHNGNGMPDENNYDQPQMSAGKVDWAPRGELAPMHQDPRAMARAFMAVAGIPGLAMAGAGLVGQIARIYNSAPALERLFTEHPDLFQRAMAEVQKVRGAGQMPGVGMLGGGRM